MKNKEKSAKELIIEAFGDSNNKSIADVCKRAGVDRTTFYLHFKQDVSFRLKIWEIQRNDLTAKINAASVGV